jgi:hypothetical protein
MLWMLEEMGLEDEIRPLDFARRHDDAEFLEASPTGSTPAIDDGEVRVFESCAILEHLGAKHGPYSRPPPPTLHFGEASLAAPLNVIMGSRFLAPEDQKQNWGALFVLAESEKWGGLPLKDQQAFITEQITPVIALRSGLVGSNRSRIVNPEQTRTSRGRISRAPRRMAKKDPTWAPRMAPSAIAKPIGQTTAPVAV